MIGKAWLLIAATLVSSELPAATARRDPAADLVLRGGHVWAGKGLPAATAIALKDGRVAALGDEADVASLVGPATRVIDLRGRLVVPGFTHAHLHLLTGGFGPLSLAPPPAPDAQEVGP